MRSESFTDTEIVPKWYTLALWTFAGIGLWTLLGQDLCVRFDSFTDWSVAALVLYIALRSMVPAFDGFKLMALGCFVFLSFIFRSAQFNRPKFIHFAILSAAVIQGIYGLYASFLTKSTDITGSFDNPAGYAACLAASVPFCLLLPGGRAVRIAGLSAAVFLCACVIASGSRAGIMACAIVAGIYLYGKYAATLSCKWRRALKIALPGLALLVCMALFAVKKDSAAGRLLVWRVSASMVAEAPVFGLGSGAFRATYMTQQAQYFAQNPDSRFAMLADNVAHPFCEYIAMMAEYGIVGLLLLGAVIWTIVRRGKAFAPWFMCLASIAVFSLFSYPFRYPCILLLTALCLASYASSPSVTVKPKWWLRSAIGGMAMVGLWYTIRSVVFETRWNNLAETFVKTERMMAHYDELDNNDASNPYFLYSYGAECNRLKQWERSAAILTRCVAMLNDYDVQMLLGDNYQNLGRYDRAESCYRLAHNMIPCRFYPLYKLMKLAEMQGNHTYAEAMAREIVGKKVKIPSYSVEMFRYEASQIINK